MPAEWTGETVGIMHLNGITRQDIAKEMNCTKAYVCMILNGERTPKGGKERITAAVNKIIKERNNNE